MPVINKKEYNISGDKTTEKVKEIIKEDSIQKIIIKMKKMKLLLNFL